VAALTLVGEGGAGGTGSQIGGVTAEQLAEVQRRLAQQEANRQAAAEARAARAAAAAARAAAAGSGTGDYTAFDPRGAFQIPNNFWGFAIMMLGMR